MNNKSGPETRFVYSTDNRIVAVIEGPSEYKDLLDLAETAVEKACWETASRDSVAKELVRDLPRGSRVEVRPPDGVVHVKVAPPPLL